MKIKKLFFKKVFFIVCASVHAASFLQAAADEQRGKMFVKTSLPLSITKTSLPKKKWKYGGTLYEVLQTNKEAVAQVMAGLLSSLPAVICNQAGKGYTLDRQLPHFTLAYIINATLSPVDQMYMDENSTLNQELKTLVGKHQSIDLVKQFQNVELDIFEVQMPGKYRYYIVMKLENTLELGALAKAITDLLAAHGVDLEHAGDFKAHITFGQMDTSVQLSKEQLQALKDKLPVLKDLDKVHDFRINEIQYTYPVRGKVPGAGKKGPNILQQPTHKFNLASLGGFVPYGPAVGALGVAYA